MRGPLNRNCKRCGADDWYHYDNSNVSACAPCQLRRAKEEKPWRGKPPRSPEDTRRHQLKHNYGITVEEYDELFEIQEGACAICGRTDNGVNQHGPMRLAVDHDHETGEVRGLLCNRCNTALGLLDDDPERLRIAARYLDG